MESNKVLDEMDFYNEYAQAKYDFYNQLKYDWLHAEDTLSTLSDTTETNKIADHTCHLSVESTHN